MKGDLEFEFEYSKGKRNGKEKEYCKDGTIIYVEYFNDKIWNGKGREYFYDG